MNSVRQAKYKVRRDYLLGRGLCVVCGKESSTKGTTRCEKCREKERAYQRNNKKYHQDKYEELKAKKICPACKKPTDRENYTYCTECCEKAKINNIKARLKNGA